MATKPSKLLQVYLTLGSPLDIAPITQSALTWYAVLNIIPQPHSSRENGQNCFYDGLDVEVGDWVATCGSGIALRVDAVMNRSNAQVCVVLRDVDGFNTAQDPEQSSNGSIPDGPGILFQLKNGVPALFPLPPSIMEALNPSFITQLLSRFLAENMLNAATPLIPGPVVVKGHLRAEKGITIGTASISFDPHAGCISFTPPILRADVVGTAEAATRLAKPIELSAVGCVSGQVTLDGSHDIELELNYSPSGVAPGVYGSSSRIPILTVGLDGRVLAATTVDVATPSDGVFTNISSSGDAIVGQNLIVAGNLVINGTTQVFESEITAIEEPILELGGLEAPVASDNKDRGVAFRWHDGMAARRGFFGFDRSTRKFTFVPDAVGEGEIFFGEKGSLDAYISWDDVIERPRSLAGYGITDAYAKHEVDKMVAAIPPYRAGIAHTNDRGLASVSFSAPMVTPPVVTCSPSQHPDITTRISVEIVGSVTEYGFIMRTRQVFSNGDMMPCAATVHWHALPAA